jgi:hypothetical protein
VPVSNRRKRKGGIKRTLPTVIRAASPPQSATTLPPPRPNRLQLLWAWVKHRGTALLLVISLAANVYQISGGPPWPVDPEIHSHDTVGAASSEVLPFTITNKSSLSPMRNVRLSCYVDLFYFSDNQTGLFSGGQFTIGTVSIPDNGPLNYKCDASDYVRIEKDGAVLMGFPSGQFLKTKSGAFRPPLKILKMCLMIAGEYKLLGIPIRFRSSMFQWPAIPGGHQWIEGPVTPDMPNEAWIPSASQNRRCVGSACADECRHDQLCSGCAAMYPDVERRPVALIPGSPSGVQCRIVALI